MSAYYNEIDPYAAQWLRNLIAAGHIAPGDVDERSIVDVRPDDLRGYRQCHFFAGIGVWSYALRLAGWPNDEEVWTGSCPCQSFSSASNARQHRRQDKLHLWPFWKRLIAERRPCIVFGEQVAQAGDWFDEVNDDMAPMGYSIGASVLPAVSVGKDHARFRLYFVCDSNSDRKPGKPVDGQTPWVPWYIGEPAEVALENGAPLPMARMRAYGNAIVPQVAAEFIRAYREVRCVV